MKKPQRFVIDESKFNGRERKILRHLAEAWSLFVELPKQHPQDTEEFVHAIHSAQRTIAIRGVRKPIRAFGKKL
jgi:hypothetical protein